MRSLQTILFFCLILCQLSVYAQIRNIEANDQQALFLEAERALEKGHLKTYTSIRNHLKDYPLLPYLDYQKTMKAIKQTSKQSESGYPLSQLKNYKTTYQDIPLWNSLLYRWLTIEAKHQRWSNFVAGYALRHKDFYSTKLNCLNALAQFEHSDDKNHLKAALPLWLQKNSQPRACDALFGLMFKQKIIKPPQIAQRFFLSIKSKKYDLAKYLVKMMPKKEQSYMKLWIKVAKNPKILARKSIQNKLHHSVFYEKIMTSLFYRLSRSKLTLAKEVYENLDKTTLSTSTKAEIVQDIAILSSHQKTLDALSWLERIPKAYLNPVAGEWRVRLSLRSKNWDHVIKAIDDLDPLLSSKSSWQYWKARGQLATGKHRQGLLLLNQVANKRNYYGFLASEHLKKPPPLHHRSLQLQSNTLKSEQANLALRRIEELMKLNRNYQAKREWFYNLAMLDEEEIHIAAKFAKEKGWHNLTILTMSKAATKNDLRLRFPLGYIKEISNNAKKQNLDPAWVLALTRQESAFAHQVRSPVGATGLMQLMPSTAKYVARKNQLPQPSLSNLKSPETNLMLGTIYLSSLNQNLNNQIVLATASYNAGINRIHRWLPDEPMDSDIWIENIPFEETRNYVKNVLTYMSIYKSLMREPFRITSVMAPVSKSKNALGTP